MKRSDKAQQVSKILNRIYKKVPIPLRHKNKFELVVAVLLSAQCTDERVNQVTPILFKKANTASKMTKIPKNTIHSHYTFSVRYRGDKYLNLSWKNFYKKYVSMGGDGFYSACINPYLEPSLKGYYKEFKKGLCPTAESLQKEIMQFKTNYRNLVDAKKKAKILKKLILQLNNLEK